MLPQLNGNLSFIAQRDAYGVIVSLIEADSTQFTLRPSLDLKNQ